jgi:dephospho-CoA kinase
MSWVFGYGSLVSPMSLARTLGRPVPTDRDWVLAVLRGYGRRWNYGSRSVRADWEIDGRPVERGLIVALGLVDAPGEWCNGAVAAVSDDELALLDRRERDYDRVDVTDRIDPAGTISGVPSPAPPRKSAVPRIVGVHSGRPARASSKRNHSAIVKAPRTPATMPSWYTRVASRGVERGGASGIER